MLDNPFFDEEPYQAAEEILYEYLTGNTNVESIIRDALTLARFDQLFKSRAVFVKKPSNQIVDIYGNPLPPIDVTVQRIKEVPNVVFYIDTVLEHNINTYIHMYYDLPTW